MTRDRGIPNRRNRKPSSRPNPKSSAQAVKDRPQPEDKPERIAIALDRFHKARKWLFSDWRALIALSLAVTGSATALSLAFLFKLPAVPNCPSIFWPLASASLRIHCAEIAAGKRTTKDLLEAIELVKTLPPDHPLHDEVKRLIEIWAQEILDLGEEAFQNGKLDEAIDTANKVPKVGTAHTQVESSIKRWRSIWSSAESLYRKAEDALRKENWRLALTEAGRLLSIDNKFWQTTKYQELSNKITATREDITKIAKAKNLIESGGLQNFSEAIKLLSEINNQSYVYQRAQEVLADTGKKMLDLAEAALDRRDLPTALDVIKQIPAAANLQKEVEDFQVLANAMGRVWNGAPEDYDAAIAEAQKIGTDRPSHNKAQQLIARWRTEKGEMAQLDRARQLSQSNRPEDQQAAIEAASQVSSSNPKSKEAQQIIDQITADIQNREDRPLIDQANQIANRGDANSLQQAIDLLSRISSRRALGGEAADKRQEYASQLQAIRDRERALNQPSPSPSVAPTAENRIQDTASAQQLLQEARSIANGGTVDSVSAAIQRADGVGLASPLRSEAQSLINEWSQQLLQTAMSQASADPAGAIAIAQRIPLGTPAHDQAQSLIQLWQQGSRR
ncbi:chromosome segregation ATPase [Pseudanabaenaceae cyanobacterium LEGE 13415]|nr:chromosome segregation ATPase [Pseudanabaenaceae cyanobacterium LEGE 13415]